VDVEVLGRQEVGRRRVVVAEQDDFTAFGYDLRALVGIGPVADDVAEAYYIIDIAFVNILQDGLERFEVRVYIGYNG
jgi:hypothetical protein